MILPWEENFDMDFDKMTSVNVSDHLPRIALTDMLHRLTLNVDRPLLSLADISVLETAQRNNSPRELSETGCQERVNAVY